mmetsp:Transcript_13320/g.36811  ORF Transcript_13320/g.36811 Transcript_13320/m.36811 type:complete len:102 (+) Transcript_13320:935-1240(+)
MRRHPYLPSPLSTNAHTPIVVRANAAASHPATSIRPLAYPRHCFEQGSTEQEIRMKRGGSELAQCPQNHADFLNDLEAVPRSLRGDLLDSLRRQKNIILAM